MTCEMELTWTLPDASVPVVGIAAVGMGAVGMAAVGIATVSGSIVCNGSVAPPHIKKLSANSLN